MFNPPFKLRYVSLALLLGNAIAVQAAPELHNFNLPAQELSVTLNQLAQSGQTKLVYADKAVQGLQAAAVKGSYTVPQALQIALGKTDLGYEVVDNKVIAVKPEKKAASEVSSDAEPTILETVNVVDKANRDANNPYNRDYNRTNSSTATKTDTPIMETPMSIQVIPQQIMKDQQVVNFDKALQNISGVYTVTGDSHEQSAAVIRGFQTFDYYRNGTRVNAAWMPDGVRETANLERIEVLKGPASLMYGRIEPGGMINVVTKQPQATPYYSLQQQFGSYNFYRTTADATGAITKDNSLLYRLNFAYENAGSYRELVKNDRVFFAPVLTWNISEKTKATFELEYKHSNDTLDQGLPAIGKRPAPVPIGRNLGEPGGQIQTTDSYWVGFDLSHAFNDNWSLHHKFNANLTDTPINAGIWVNSPTGVCNTATCSMDRAVQSSHWQGQQYYTSLDLTGKFETGFIKHTLLFGGDYFNARAATTTALKSSAAQPIDLFNPVHTGIPANLLNNPDWSDYFAIHEDWYGFYAQDQAKLPYNISLLAGFRYDNAGVKTNETFTFGNSPSASHGSQRADAVKPRFGIAWQPIPELSVYGNYVENFGLASTFARSSSGAPLPPQTAEQFEAGLKTELFDKRFTGSLAWFDLTKQNIATRSPDPTLASRGVAVNTGEVHNKGLELNLAGEIYPGLNVIGSYAYTNTKITKDNNGNEGHRFFNVPRHGGSLWTTYELQEGNMRGLKLGAGTVVRGQREGDNANSFQLPGFATVSLMTSYSWHIAKSKVTTQLNVDNLLNKVYYNSSQNSSSGGIFAGAPLSLMGSIKIEY